MIERVQREFEVPCDLEAAWNHVIDPSWLGEEGELEARPDGEGWVRDRETTRYLVVEEVDEQRRLVYRWASFTDAPSLVEIDLAPSGAGTRISITESPLEARAQLVGAR